LPGDTSPPGDGAPLAGTGSSTFSATGEISLQKEEDRVVGRVYSVDEQIKRGVARLRRWMAGRVVRVFVQANCVTLAALGVLVVLDEVNIYFRLAAPGDRIITNQVIMTLLGATTVQVGVIAAIIARYLFPGRAVD
jgi:hypothetical protein